MAISNGLEINRFDATHSKVMTKEGEEAMLSRRWKNRAIALGFFDGVHLGHSALIRLVCKIGVEKELVPSVITFDTHPDRLIRGEAVPLINSMEDRAGLMRRLFDIDDALFIKFDKPTSRMPWERFVEHLASEFGARHLVAGTNYSFGRDGEGSGKLLERKCAEMGIGCDIIPEIKHEGITVSSTIIREMISGGDIERANSFLGHPHVLSDVVRYGYRLGSELNTPTINMCFEDGVLIPAHGVYATKVFLHDGKQYNGVTNVGSRPTVDDSGAITAETHILGFKGNLYGLKVRIEFYAFLRPEIKFNCIDELKSQIQKDCIAAEAVFAC